MKPSASSTVDLKVNFSRHTTATSPHSPQLTAAVVDTRRPWKEDLSWNFKWTVFGTKLSVPCKYHLLKSKVCMLARKKKLRPYKAYSSFSFLASDVTEEKQFQNISELNADNTTKIYKNALDFSDKPDQLV